MTLPIQQFVSKTLQWAFAFTCLFGATQATTGYAQTCDCSLQRAECCDTWNSREYLVRGRITTRSIEVGNPSLTYARSEEEGAAPRSTRLAATRPSPRPIRPLLPPFPLALDDLEGTMAEHYANYNRLLEAENNSQSALDPAVRAMELQLTRQLSQDNDENPEKWLLIGALRERVARRAYLTRRERIETCQSRGEENCGEEPPLSYQHARQAYVRAAQLGQTTSAGLEGTLRAADTLIETPRTRHAIDLLTRVRNETQGRLADRARALLTIALLRVELGPEAVEAVGTLTDLDAYRAFARYGRLSGLADRGRPQEVIRAAHAFLGLPETPTTRPYRHNAAELAAAAATELGRWGAEGVEGAPPQASGLLHAALAERAWASGRTREALTHAERGMAFFSPPDATTWRQRIREGSSRRRADGNNPSRTSTSGPNAEAGMLAWMAHAAHRCLNASAEGENPFIEGRVHWNIRLRRDEIVSRPHARANIQGIDALLRCLRRPAAPPIQPRRSVVIDAQLEMDATGL